MKTYGKELIVDIHKCDVLRFTRELISKFMCDLCHLIDMEREDLHFWDYDGYEEEYNDAPAHLKGISAVQFIRTSNITIHTLDELKIVYLNIFSCKAFDAKKTLSFCESFFDGKIVSSKEIDRV